MPYSEREERERAERAALVGRIVKYVGSGLAVVGLFIVGCLYGCPQYNVWEQRLQGEAELARASQNRQIRVQEAEAKKDSAVLEAQAEVERAKGMAKANQILGESLAGEQGGRYLQYLWIVSLEKGDNREVIYVPTNENGRLADLPAQESTRLLHLPSPPKTPAAK